MRILITGATGYLGTHLLKDKLLKNSDNLVIIAKDKEVPDNLLNQENVEIYDSTDEDLEKAFNNKIDYCIHMATLYGRSQEDDLQVLNVNLLLPLKILTLAIAKGTNLFFNVDTAIENLINSYILTKKTFRNYGKLYSQNSKIRFVNLKLQHFYGPFDKNVKFVSYALENFRKNAKEFNATLGEQKRNFIYIDDLVKAISLILDEEKEKREKKYVEYEIGANYNITIRETLETIKKLTNSKTKINFGAIPYRKNEEMESICDNSKIKKLGWASEVKSFEEGINKILKTEGNK